jgi:hypothetical protein
MKIAQDLLVIQVAALAAGKVTDLTHQVIEKSETKTASEPLLILLDRNFIYKSGILPAYV